MKDSDVIDCLCLAMRLPTVLESAKSHSDTANCTLSMYIHVRAIYRRIADFSEALRIRRHFETHQMIRKYECDYHRSTAPRMTLSTRTAQRRYMLPAQVATRRLWLYWPNGAESM